MVQIFFLVGIALAATQGVLAAPVSRDLNVNKPPDHTEHTLVRRAEDGAGGKRGPKRKEEVTNKCGNYKPPLPSSGTFSDTKFCPWGPGGCRKYGGWDRAMYFKSHMEKFHDSSVPDDCIVPIPVEMVRHNKKYVVGVGRGDAELHTPKRTSFRGRYKPRLACPWACHVLQTDGTKVPLTWSAPSALVNHVQKVHGGKTEKWFNYPNTARQACNRIGISRQHIRQYNGCAPTARGQKRKPTSGPSSQPPHQAGSVTRCGQEKSLSQMMIGSASNSEASSSFEGHVNIPGKPCAQRHFIDFNRAANPPTPNVDVDLSPNQPHNQPPKQARPPLDLNEAPTWSGLTDPGFPGGGRDSGGVEAGPSASSRWHS
jgi:hypothetical protein